MPACVHTCVVLLRHHKRLMCDDTKQDSMEQQYRGLDELSSTLTTLHKAGEAISDSLERGDKYEFIPSRACRMAEGVCGEVLMLVPIEC